MEMNLTDNINKVNSSTFHDVAMQTVGLALIYFSIIEIILALITLID